MLIETLFDKRTTVVRFSALNGEEAESYCYGAVAGLSGPENEGVAILKGALQLIRDGQVDSEPELWSAVKQAVVALWSPIGTVTPPWETPR